MERKTLVALFVAAVLIRAAFVLTLGNHPYFDDEFEYLRMAQNFLSGHGLIVGETLKGFRPPLYPLALSGLTAMHAGLAGIRFFQVLLSAATVLLVYRCGREAFSPRTGLTAGWIACVYPFFVFYNGFVLTETLFIFLVAAAVLLCIRLPESGRTGPAAAAGIALGLAGLCRPTMQLFLPCAALLILFFPEHRGLRWRKILLVTAFFCLTLSPWIVRNFIVFHKIMPGTTMGGRVFWEGNNPQSEGGPCSWFPPDLERTPEPVRDAAYYVATLRVIRANPRRFLWLLGNKFRRFWNVVPNASAFTSPLYRIASIGSFGLLMPLFLLGTVLSLGNRKAWFFLSLILLFTVFHMVFLASIRYRVPVEPFYIIIAAYGIVYLADRIPVARFARRTGRRSG